MTGMAQSQRRHHGAPLERELRPCFVDRPTEMVRPGPFVVENADVRCFWLHADARRMTALCRRVFGEPSGGAVDVAPLGTAVALVFAAIGSMRSLAPGEAERGSSDENEAGFWIPVRVRDASGERLAWFVSHMLVDSAHALVIGREVYGFPKALGWIGIPSRAGSGIHSVDAIALDRPGPDARPSLGRVMEVRPSTSIGVVRSMFDVARAMTGTAWFGLGAHASNLLGRREVPVVLLRQLRAADDPMRAAFQEIVEVPLHLRDVRDVAPLRQGFVLDVFDRPDLPIGAELGLDAAGHEIVGGVRANLDFELRPARTLWRAADRGPDRTSSHHVAPSRRREKIAVLGGGMASISAVLALTDDPEWAERYEITVYQTGFRLGGKCASGRNAEAGQRIEEHGLHVWFGCYDNAFRLIRATYAALGRDPEHPLGTWDKAFTRHGTIELTERVAGDWATWRLEYPQNDHVPGDGGPLRNPADWVTALGRWVKTAVSMALLPPGTPSGLGAARAFASNVAMGAAMGTLKVIERATAALAAGASRSERSAAATVLSGLRERLVERALGRVEEDVELRRRWILADLGLTALIGIAADDVLSRGFSALDDEDLVEWLTRHGASRTTVTSAPIRTLYDLVFAYERGDTRRPNLAAGTMLQAVLRMLFAYSGALMWKMTAGMGDVVFAPAYELLRRRGVRFEFFHRVLDVAPSSGGDEIETIRIGRQATVAGAGYEPLVDVGGVPCWPEHPLYDQLVEGAELRHSGASLESARSTWHDVEELVLRRGVDFDRVVLGIPVAALPSICPQLIERSPAWQNMVAHVRSVPTLAMQLWLKPTRAQLGGSSGAPIVGGFSQPFDTCADMTHLLDAERWPESSRPGHVAYFCGPLDERPWDGEGHAERERQRVVGIARDFLERDARVLWPSAVRPGSEAFDWELLVDLEQRAGSARLEAQVIRANVEPSDLYVQSQKGSSRFRLRPEQSGFDNLVLAGDWTDTGMNLGCVEAAVVSGLRCARALGANVLIQGERAAAVTAGAGGHAAA